MPRPRRRIKRQESDCSEDESPSIMNDLIKVPAFQEALKRGAKQGLYAGLTDAVQWVLQHCIEYGASAFSEAARDVVDEFTEATLDKLMSQMDGMRNEASQSDFELRCKNAILFQLQLVAAVWYVMGAVTGLEEGLTGRIQDMGKTQEQEPAAHA